MYQAGTGPKNRWGIALAGAVLCLLLSVPGLIRPSPDLGTRDPIIAPLGLVVMVAFILIFLYWWWRAAWRKV